MDYKTKVEEIMTTDLTTVNPQTTVEEFKEKFKKRKFHHLPVESETGELLGIISTEDVNKIQRVLPLETIVKAEHVMTANPVKLSPDTLVAEAGKMFLENNFRALPVVDKKGILIGLVTPYDVLRALLKTYKSEEEMEGMEDYV